MGTIKDTYRKSRRTFTKMKFYCSINWIKTLYFNFKKFPFQTARKLPVFFYGRVKLHDISGEIVIEAPIKRGMIGFGQSFELIRKAQGISEFYLTGKLICKGHAHFGKDYLIYIGENALCEMGHMFGMGTKGKLICYNEITFGDYVRVGFESQIIDSNFHQMYDTVTGEKSALTSKIKIGNYNWVGNRSSVMQKTNTPDYCIISSNSLANKDYSHLGNHILIGGIPAQLIRNNISRDWEGERENMEKWLCV